MSMFNAFIFGSVLLFSSVLQAKSMLNDVYEYYVLSDTFICNTNAMGILIDEVFPMCAVNPKCEKEAKGDYVYSYAIEVIDKNNFMETGDCFLAGEKTGKEEEYIWIVDDYDGLLYFVPIRLKSENDKHEGTLYWTFYRYIKID